MKKIGIIMEIMMIVIMIVITAVFAVKTISDTPSIKECQEIASSIEKIEVKINDPTKWVIENVSSNYSECEVTHGDGWTYTHSVYEYYNEDNHLVIVLKTQNGELHKFAYFE